MALDEFWRNVNIAASLLWPDVIAPRLDSDRRARILKNAALWLTPATVAGFDADDFEFLSPSEGQDLKESVERFRRAAESVPDDRPANPEQVEQALRELRRILEILRPDRNPGVDYFRAGKVLENLRFPYDVRDDVVHIIHEFDTDWTGEPGVWIWAILKDDVLDRPSYLDDTETIQKSIEVALLRQGVRLSPHVHFRTSSEQKELARTRRK